MPKNTKQIRITLAQINPTVGALTQNSDMIQSHIKDNQKKSDLIIFPELAVTAYSPEDLLLRNDFIEDSFLEVDKIRQSIDTNCVVIIGLPFKEEGNLYNALIVLDKHGIVERYYKRILPNYKVFDEERYFKAGKQAKTISVCGIRFGLCICEDIWEPLPIKESIALGAECIISINASPFHYQKYQQRKDLVRKLSADNKKPIIYVNQVGGQDELVFDGSSFISDHNGDIICLLDTFRSSTHTCNLSIDVEGQTQCDNNCITTEPPRNALIYQALVTGLKDYVIKNGFNKTILGLSGGIDSALVAAITVDALGKDSLEAVMMPYHYTSQWSIEDAEEEATLLGIKYHVIPIEPIVTSILNQLSTILEDQKEDNTEENIQARSRGLILMAISNNNGSMVLTTGNKSEMAVGYATLYGDMVGGFSVIKDIPKTLVYELAVYRNSISRVIPERVITRPPSAELKPNQVDQDSLPDYDILDAILERFIEKDDSPKEIIKFGFDEEVVKKVVEMVVRNEYKRRQSAPGIRITPRSFGHDRRYPITSGYF